MIKNRKIATKLLTLNIVSVFIIILFTFSGINTSLKDRDNTENLILCADRIYVELSEHFNIENTNNKNYIESLKKEYNNLEIIIYDKNENIKLKTDGVDEAQIDLNQMQYIMRNKNGDFNPFMQEYKLIDNGQTFELVIFKYRSLNSTVESHIIRILFPIIVVLIIEYLIIRRKVKQLIYITDGIVTMSNENSEYRLELNSNDEFGILSHEINKMSSNLKIKIDNERNMYKLKNELIANISHDLRTPLTSLIGYMEIAKNLDLKLEEKNDYIKKSLEKAERIKILICELFEYSKLESGEVTINKIPINIIEMIEQTIGEYSNLAYNNYLNIVKLYNEFEIITNIDGNIMIRVFENLLDNAIKYSKKNTKIYIDVINDEGYVTITLENTMEEIIEYDSDILFDRFYRGDKSRNQKISGSGLGLFISKSIVDLHGGEIHIETEVHRFKVYIKLPTV